jgi:methyltransferase (TIGR00027 family)
MLALVSTQSSRTALMVAAYRARATAKKDAICNDPWATALAGDEGHAIARAYDEVFPYMELWIAVRTAFIDALVRRFTADFEQVVVLGAGFDTRAARLARSGVRFFEVDQSESQRNKLARLATLEGYPDAATYVTCDFEREDFLERLGQKGFDAARPALFLWEGVTPYLTEPAVRATLRRVAQGTHGASVLVFDHVRRKIVAGEVREARDLESRAFVADLGEPLRFGIDYPLPLLYEEGFRRVRAMTFDEICLDVTGTYDRERAFRFQGIVLASRTTSLV